MRQSQACGGSLVLKNRATSTGSMKTPCKIWKTTLANKRENHKLVSLEAKKSTVKQNQPMTVILGENAIS